MDTRTDNDERTRAQRAELTPATFNDKRRHELVGLQYDGKPYDIRHFDGLTGENLGLLMTEGYADPTETQNDSPDISEIRDFLDSNPDFTAHGYIVTPNRNDCRVSLEGVASNVKTSAQLEYESLEAFVDMFRTADEFSLNPPRAWYD